MDASRYNYAHFDEYVDGGGDVVEFGSFHDRLHAGERAPDLEATRLDDGEAVRLSELWRQRTLVVEFGSYT